jgi:hypothetical protein
MYSALATCGPDGTWLKDANATIMCACYPKSTGTGGTTVTGTGGAPGFNEFVQEPGIGVCDCGGETGAFGLIVSLECACDLAVCKPHDHPAQLPSFDCASNSFDRQRSYIARGCGLVAIVTNHGLGGTTLVYRESDHELLGAAVSSDIGWGACKQFAYATANADLSQCPDYTMCSPCSGGDYPLCSDGDVDAGF